MTVPEFLKRTTIPKKEIADECDVHVSRVYDWENGKANPEGPQLLRLVELSGFQIRAADLPKKNRGGHFRNPKTKRRSA